MTDINIKKRINRTRRHARTRAKVSGTAERPRIAVFKSNQYTYAQAVDDVARRVIASANDRTAKKGTKTERAQATGVALAKRLNEKNIATAVFDAGGFRYHGRVKAVADALRENGMKL